MLMESYNILSWKPGVSIEAKYADKLLKILNKRSKRDFSNVVRD